MRPSSSSTAASSFPWMAFSARAISRRTAGLVVGSRGGGCADPASRDRQCASEFPQAVCDPDHLDRPAPSAPPTASGADPATNGARSRCRSRDRRGRTRHGLSPVPRTSRAGSTAARADPADLQDSDRLVGGQPPVPLGLHEPERREAADPEGVDQLLQTQMLSRRVRHARNGGTPDPVTVAGSPREAGFHADLERMRERGWRIEVVSWRRSCARRMRKRAIEHGVFIALEDYYESVTFSNLPHLDIWSLPRGSSSP